MAYARPRAAYATDMPIQELLTAELLLVSTLRLWVAPYRDPEPVGADWRRGFEVARLPERASLAFDGLLRVLAIGAVRSLDIRCRRCPALGEDEALLLQLVALLQHARWGEAEAVLEDWLPTRIVPLALSPAKALATTLAAGGFVIPLRRAEAAEFERRALAGYADSGLTLVQ